MCSPCCPTPRAARVYFLAMLIVALILLGFSLWELLYSNAFVSSGGSCGFPLAASAQTQGWVNLAAAATLGLTSLLFGALACVGVTCCTEVVATVIHILAAVVVLVDNAYMSVIVFQQNRWPASYDSYTGAAVLNCDATFYRTIASACARAHARERSESRARHRRPAAPRAQSTSWACGLACSCCRRSCRSSRTACAAAPSTSTARRTPPSAAAAAAAAGATRARSRSRAPWARQRACRRAATRPSWTSSLAAFQSSTEGVCFASVGGLLLTGSNFLAALCRDGRCCSPSFAANACVQKDGIEGEE